MAGLSKLREMINGWLEIVRIRMLRHREKVAHSVLLHKLKMATRGYRSQEVSVMNTE